MGTSLIYRNLTVYESAMIALYGRHYFARYEAVADLIPASASVLDLCCGPGILYDRYLRHKAISYTGLDINSGFIKRLNERGGKGLVWDLRNPDSIPQADYVIMQASLYHFLPNAEPIVDRMLRAARFQVVIAEPIRNLASSNWHFLAAIGEKFTKTNDDSQSSRFTEETADQFFSIYSSRLLKSFLIPGGREKIYILDAANAEPMTTPNTNTGVPELS